MKTLRMIPLLCLAAALAAAAPAAAQNEYRIGALFAVTGPNGMLGAPEKNTVEMLTDALNAAGGINGVPVKAIIIDTEGDPTKAVTGAKRLISSDKVDVLIGPTTSGESLAVLEVAEKEEIPLISCAASWKIVNADRDKPPRKWTFKSPQSDSLAVDRIFAAIKAQGFSRIAIISVSNGYGASGREELLRMAPAFGLTVVADEKYGEKDTDMSTQLTKIKGTEAQALVCWGTNPGPALIARNRKQLGMAIPLYNSHGIAARKFIEIAGDSADGTFLPAGKLLVAEQLADSDPQKKILVKYKTDYETRFKEPVSTFGGHGYDAFEMAVMALKAAGKGASKSVIRDEIEKIRGFSGTAGIFNMSPEDHNGLGKDSFVMVTIEKGEWKLVK